MANQNLKKPTPPATLMIREGINPKLNQYGILRPKKQEITESNYLNDEETIPTRLHKRRVPQPSSTIILDRDYKDASSNSKVDLDLSVPLVSKEAFVTGKVSLEKEV